RGERGTVGRMRPGAGGGRGAGCAPPLPSTPRNRLIAPDPTPRAPSPSAPDRARERETTRRPPGTARQQGRRSGPRARRRPRVVDHQRDTPVEHGFLVPARLARRDLAIPRLTVAHRADLVRREAAHRRQVLLHRLRPGLAETQIVLRAARRVREALQDRKSTRLHSSHVKISYAVFCLKKKTA